MTAEATTGAIQLWSAEPPTHAELSRGIVLGRAAAEELGLHPGMLANQTRSGIVQSVGAVLDTEARNPSIARWMINVIPPTGNASQCWVEFAPELLAVGLQVLEASFSDLKPDIEVRQWISLDEFARDPVAELANRPQRMAWVPTGIVVGLLIWLTVWVRTAEVGLYRAVGTSNSALLFLGQLETLYVVVPSCAAGFMWAAAIRFTLVDRQPELDELLIAARSSASAVLLILAFAPLAWLWVGRDRIAAQLKDR